MVEMRCGLRLCGFALGCGANRSRINLVGMKRQSAVGKLRSGQGLAVLDSCPRGAIDCGCVGDRRLI